MNTPFSRTLRSLNSQRYAQKVTIIIILMIVLVLWVLWLFFAHVNLYEVSNKARLEVDVSVYPVEVPIDGKIIESRIEVGEQVNKNDILLRLDSKSKELELAELQAQYSSLNNEIEALKDEIASVDKVSGFGAQEEKVGVQEAKERYEESKVAIEFANERLKRIEELHNKGQVPQLDLLKARADHEKQLASGRVLYKAFIKAKQARSKNGSDIEARLKRLQYELVQDEGKLNIADAGISRIKFDIEEHTIRAPVSGRIGELSGTQIGTVVKAGDELGVIIPSDKLKAVAYFKPSDAIGRLRKGQSGKLSIDGFPWMQYGSLPVTVTTVSGEVKDGLIKVELEVIKDSTTLIPIQHGMPAVAEIEINKLPPIMLILRSVGKMIDASVGSINN